MADTPVPTLLRRALADAMGGWGPFTVREIETLFSLHGFDEEADAPPEQGVRRQTAANLVAGIDWAHRGQKRRFLDLIQDVLEHFPRQPGESPLSAGRALRGALERTGVSVGDDDSLSPGTPSPDTPEPPVPPAATIEDDDPLDIWPPNRIRLFMSHVSADKAYVGAVAEELDSTTFACFVAHEEIRPSLRWQEIIESALDTCNVLVALVSETFQASDWCDQEVGWALGRGLVVVPVNLAAQPYGFFGSFQAIQVRERPATEIAREIAYAIVTAVFRRQRPGSEVLVSPLADGVVRAFCQSRSFDAARRRFDALKQIPPEAWSTVRRDAVREACRSNPQIREANFPRGQSVPDAVDRLIGG
jgi:hypothetical protein